jgi:hypothetical protein
MKQCMHTHSLDFTITKDINVIIVRVLLNDAAKMFNSYDHLPGTRVTISSVSTKKHRPTSEWLLYLRCCHHGYILTVRFLNFQVIRSYFSLCSMKMVTAQHTTRKKILQKSISFMLCALYCQYLVLILGSASMF